MMSELISATFKLNYRCNGNTDPKYYKEKSTHNKSCFTSYRMKLMINMIRLFILEVLGQFTFEEQLHVCNDQDEYQNNY